jgi:hypothetical protein
MWWFRANIVLCGKNDFVSGKCRYISVPQNVWMLWAKSEGSVISASWQSTEWDLQAFRKLNRDGCTCSILPFILMDIFFFWIPSLFTYMKWSSLLNKWIVFRLDDWEVCFPVLVALSHPSWPDSLLYAVGSRVCLLDKMDGALPPCPPPFWYDVIRYFSAVHIQLGHTHP